MASVKTIGASGQISLGKEHAGRHALVDEIDPGVWIVKLGELVPDSERWLQGAEATAAVTEAVSWAEQTVPALTDLDHLTNRLNS
ncbi:MAG: hypothetical protein V1750_09380 [Acidobacteriota bacterium]